MFTILALKFWIPFTIKKSLAVFIEGRKKCREQGIEPIFNGMTWVDDGKNEVLGVNVQPLPEPTPEPVHGMRWVKATYDNLPDTGKQVYVRYNHNRDTFGDKEIGGKALIIELLENGWLDVEYLDESLPLPVEGKEDWISVDTEYKLQQFREEEPELFTDGSANKRLSHVGPMNRMLDLINSLEKDLKNK